MSLLKPNFGSGNEQLPGLPEIYSAAIEQRVFTHRSFFARPTHIFEDHISDLSPDNEKYEHLGDTVLGLSVTDMMLKEYPGLRVGPSTKMRALIVGNLTLAEISLKYKLPDRLRLHPAQAVTLRASTNVQADVFESFIGGLYLDQGFDAVRKWLDPLFLPYARAAYAFVRHQHGLPPVLPTPNTSPCSSPRRRPNVMELSSATTGHLALFNQHLQKADRTVEWIYSESADDDSIPLEKRVKISKITPMWFVTVEVDGKVYGRGRGNTKKAARNEAAKEGLMKLGVFV